MSKAALLVVDAQNDFLPPKGRLMVPAGMSVVPVITELLTDFEWQTVIASQDYHPEGHISFASSHPGKKVNQEIELKDARGMVYEQRLWPDHCLQNTVGAEIQTDILPVLKKQGDKFKIVRKGWHKGVEGYSAFDGYLTDGVNPAEPPTEVPPMQIRELKLFLREQGVTKIVIAGLATDYCVAHTALSALACRFQVALVAPATRGMDPMDTTEVYDKVEALGGVAIGRENSTIWEDELRAWLRD